MDDLHEFTNALNKRHGNTPSFMKLKDCDGTPEAIIIATGSEVGIAQQATDALNAQGRKVRLVSIPCTELFERQDASYQAQVLPASVTARVAVEAAHADYWYKYVGLTGKVIGMTDFGASAPAKELFEMYGFTVDKITATVTELL